MAQPMTAQGRLLHNEPLARYTSWRVGGAADRFYIPAGLDDLAAFLQALDAAEPLYFIGLGSNLLVRDGGVRGTVAGIVARVKTLDRQGAVHERTPEEYEVSYRHVAGPQQECFVGAWFELPPGDAAEAEQKIKHLLARRLATQPLNLPNAGSTFRNPAGDHAARLIEASGLKGYRIGDAQVSEKHANFIVNLGAARAADIERLIAHMRDTVRAQHGVELQQEVRIIGEEVNG